MKKITKRYINNKLMNNETYSSICEPTDDSMLYKKYKWLPFLKANEELNDFLEDEGVYFDFYTEYRDEEDEEIANKKFSEFCETLPHGLEMVNEDNIQSAFVNYRSFNPLLKRREKEYDELEKDMRLAVSEYSEYLNFRVN